MNISLIFIIKIRLNEILTLLQIPRISFCLQFYLEFQTKLLYFTMIYSSIFRILVKAL
jgi:hypothetical protein